MLSLQCCLLLYQNRQYRRLPLTAQRTVISLQHCLSQHIRVPFLSYTVHACTRTENTQDCRISPMLSLLDHRQHRRLSFLSYTVYTCARTDSTGDSYSFSTLSACSRTDCTEDCHVCSSLSLLVLKQTAQKTFTSLLHCLCLYQNRQYRRLPFLSCTLYAFTRTDSTEGCHFSPTLSVLVLEQLMIWKSHFTPTLSVLVLEQLTIQKTVISLLHCLCFDQNNQHRRLPLFSYTVFARTKTTQNTAISLRYCLSLFQNRQCRRLPFLLWHKLIMKCESVW